MKEILKKVSHLISDKTYIKIKYFMKFKKRINLKKPETFNEKLQWLKLNDRKEIYSRMVDKYEAKKIIKETVGEKYVIKTLGIYNNFDEINFDELPNKFVIKCTHDSGGVFICNNKENFDIEYVKKQITLKMKNNFYYSFREWPYKNVKSRIIIEEFIGNNLTDYRFYCFNGKVELIYMYINENQDIDKPEPTKCNIYDINWNLQNFHQNSLPTKEKYDCPKKLKEMIDIAEKLSNKTKFLRVDMYIKNDNILVGELTFFPGAGFSKFHPEYIDLELGKKLNLA